MQAVAVQHHLGIRRQWIRRILSSSSSPSSSPSSHSPPPLPAATSSSANRISISSSSSSSSSMASASPLNNNSRWAQKTITIPPLPRGCHLLTSKILKEIGHDLSSFKCGLAHLFLQHTSASLTINENYDSDVREDTETFLSTIVPEGNSAPWKHTLEGPDDMPAHIKSSMFGCSLMIPITDGKLNMGTWQVCCKMNVTYQGREYGFVSTAMKLPHAELSSPLME